MLLVKTHLKESTIPEAGVGCFASEFIRKGTKIWLFNPDIDRRITQEQFKKFSKMEQEFLSMYCYMHQGDYYLCADNGRFFNHSTNPNTYESPDEQATFAMIDINIGDEILSDYAAFGDTAEDRMFNTIL
jgi:hypothetical protein